MRDQVAALKLAGVAAEAIHSGNGRDENVAAWRRAAAGELKLLYMAPERLMTERMLAALARLPVGLIAVDEAHCISQWGPSFRPEYEALTGLRGHFPGVPIAGLTATADEATRGDIRARLLAPDARCSFRISTGPTSSSRSSPRPAPARSSCPSCAAIGARAGSSIACRAGRAEEFAADLAAEGIRALPYHAGMDAADRTANQDIFIAEPGW